MYEYLQKLIAWQKEGRRSVDFKMNPDNEMKIWIYDYDLTTGKYVEVGDSLPTKEDLLKKKRERLLCELDSTE